MKAARVLSLTINRTSQKIERDQAVKKKAENKTLRLCCDAPESKLHFTLDFLEHVSNLRVQILRPLVGFFNRCHRLVSISGPLICL